MLGRIVTVVVLAVGGVFLSLLFRKSRGMGMSSSITESIEVKLLVRIAYNQWTQFEEFPQFMDSVSEVRQLSDTRLHWRADIAGKEKEWEAELTEQIPDKRIAWKRTGGVRNGGVVTFHKISDDTTRVTLQMDYAPETMTEQIGDALGAVRMQVRSNLKRFKDLIESRGAETGAWRGTVAQH